MLGAPALVVNGYKSGKSYVCCMPIPVKFKFNLIISIKRNKTKKMAN